MEFIFVRASFFSRQTGSWAGLVDWVGWVGLVGRAGRGIGQPGRGSCQLAGLAAAWSGWLGLAGSGWAGWAGWARAWAANGLSKMVLDFEARGRAKQPLFF